MTRDPCHRVTFHAFELDLDSGDLLRDGQPVRLAAQPAKALVLLVERAGELVPRGDIQSHVWGDLVIEQEQGLNTCIRQIRTALGDRSGTAKYIETVPRRGYRFIAPVSPLPSTNSASLKQESATTEGFGPSLPNPALTRPSVAEIPPASGRQALTGRLATVALVLVLTVLAAQWLRRAPSSSTSLEASTPSRAEKTGDPVDWTRIPERPMLAVLPFESLGGGEAERVFALGLTEEITTELASHDPDRLGVISRASVKPYAASVGADLARLGQDLGVDCILRGSIRQDGETARVSVRLVRMADQSHLWAERFDRPLEDVLDVQLEIARQVVSALVPELLPDRSSVAPAVVPLAWEAFLRGRYLLEGLSPPDPARARVELQRALDLDPRLAVAHVAWSDSYHAERRSGTLELQRDALSQALRIDPELAAAHLRLGKIQLYADWDFVAAGRSFAKAVELAPGDAEARQGYALYLSHLRRHDEAIEHVERARQLDPISAAVHGDGGNIYFSARRYEKAVEVCARTLELAPGHYEARSCLLHAYRRLGRHRQAVQQALELMRLLGASADEVRSVAEYGDPALSLIGFFEWQAEWLRSQGASPVAMAAAVLPLGRVDEVFAWLERAYEQRSGSLLAIAADPRADAFREDPRFVDLLRRVGFPKETIER